MSLEDVVKWINKQGINQPMNLTWIELYFDGSGDLFCLEPTGEYNKHDDKLLLEWNDLEELNQLFDKNK